MLNKRLSDLTHEDINQLIEDGAPEDEQLEFKKTLPTKDGGDDPWVASAGQQKFGNRARDEIAQEVVAFANRDGGLILIGIVDSNHRAHSLNFIPRCHDLAGRLERSLNEIIEPKIAGLAARGLEFGADGSGVVVIRVEASIRAPHRLIPTKECYIRRREETVAMTMREIQDVTLDVASGTQRITDRLAEIESRIPRYEQYLSELFLPKNTNPNSRWIAFGSIAVPLERVSIRDHLQRYDLPSGSLSFTATKSTLPPAPVVFPIRAINAFEPRLGAAVARGSNESLPCEVGYASDGAIWSFCGIHENRPPRQSMNVIYKGWIIGMVANTLTRIEEVRKLAASPYLRFAMSILLRPRGDWRLSGYPEWGEGSAPLPIKEFVTFEPYEIGSREEFPRLVSMFDRDIMNLFGKRAMGDVLLSFP